MTWNRDERLDSGRSRRPDSLGPRGGRRPASSLRPTLSSSKSLSPAGRRPSTAPSATRPVSSRPPGVDEELWFGSQDASVAEETAARSMAAMVGRIIGAKPFPESARRLEQLTRTDVVRIEPVIQVLERDPALSARLLRLVNSAGYALRQRCASVRHAATLVGTDRLHQIATTAAVLDLFDSRGGLAAKIIEHSTVVGAYCRYLGAHLALPVDDLFTAGFLHDIGKLMLLETEGDQYCELLQSSLSRGDSIHQLERSLFGFDHAVLAAHVLTAWNIPDPVPKIVAWHHDPTRAYKASSMMAALVQTVRLADAAVYAMFQGADDKQLGQLAQLDCASYLDVSEPQLASMWEELAALRDQSVEQCRGANAPALEPASMRPKRPVSLAAVPASEAPRELPLQFPCVVCSHPTFGNTCPACGGHVCPDHQIGREGWCSICSLDYRSRDSDSPVPVSLRYALWAAAGTVLVSGIVGMVSAGGGGALRAAFGTLLLMLLVGLLWLLARRWLTRSAFIRTRPDRSISMAAANHGGVISLVPAGEGGAASGPDADWAEQLRIVAPVADLTISEVEPVCAPTAAVALTPNDDSALPTPDQDPPERSCAGAAATSNPPEQQTLGLRQPLDTRRGPGKAAESQRRKDTNSPSQSAQPISRASSPRDEAATTAMAPSPAAASQAAADAPAAAEAQPSASPGEPLASPIETAAVHRQQRPSGSTPKSGQSRQSTKNRAARRDSSQGTAAEKHPLAALGLTSARPPARAPEPVEPIDGAMTTESTAPSTSQAQARTDGLEPAPPEGSSRGAALALDPDVPEPAGASATPPTSPTDVPASAAAPGTTGATPAAVMPTGEPEANPVQAAASALGESLLTHLGKDFESRVLELVAQRVADIVASRMMASLGAPTSQPAPARQHHHHAGKSQHPVGPKPNKRTGRRQSRGA